VRLTVLCGGEQVRWVLPRHIAVSDVVSVSDTAEIW
jgi:hypothetical protein